MTSTIDPAHDARTVSSPPCGALRRPAELHRDIDVSGLVDSDGGLLDRAVFTDPQV